MAGILPSRSQAVDRETKGGPRGMCALLRNRDRSRAQVPVLLPLPSRVKPQPSPLTP